MRPILLALMLAVACSRTSTAPAPANEVCPILTTTNRIPNGPTVRTWAYFKNGKDGPTYAATITYDTTIIPPCLAF